MIRRVKHYSTLKMLERIGFINLIGDESKRFHYVDYDKSSLRGLSIILPYNKIWYTHRYFVIDYVSGCFYPFVFEFRFHKNDIAKIKHLEGKHDYNRCSEDCPYLTQYSPIAYNGYCSFAMAHVPWATETNSFRHTICNQVCRFVKEQ